MPPQRERTVIISFSHQLRHFRRLRGLSQQALGRRVGLSMEAISILERGLRSPGVTTTRLLADALRLDRRQRDDLLARFTSRVPAENLLPRYSDELIGRDRDVEDVAQLLQVDPARLVTLTGPGGVGKTRLAVAAAHLARAHFPDGVRWLASIESMDVPQLVRAVATSVGARAGTDPWSGITAAADGAGLLLVIDGAEGSLPAVATVVQQLLVHTPAVTVLVTSRQRLGLTGEVLVEVSPLGLPELTSDGSPSDVDDSPASRLFMARASLPGAVEGDSRRSSVADAAAIAQICHQVDGLPLALEAAAAQTTVWAIAELATALSASLDLLVSGTDEGRGLAAVLIGNSFAALAEPEQTLLAQLSVYADRFDQADVHAIADPVSTKDETSATLALLVAKSLVIQEDTFDGAAHFRLLRVTREFAGRRLADRPDHAAVRQRFARRVGDLAGAAAHGLTGRASQLSASTLDERAGDLDRAMAWSIRHDHDTALTLVGAQWRWWQLRGRYRPGRVAAAAALGSGRRSPATLRAPAYTAAGLLALLQSDYERAQTFVQRGLDLYAAAEDTVGLRWSLALLGTAAQERGDYIVSAQLHQQSLVLATRTDDGLGIASQLGALSRLAWLRGQLGKAEDCGQQALDLSSSLGDQLSTAITLTDLGTISRCRGDLRGAQVHLDHGLELSRRIGYREGIAWSLHQLGVISRLQGDLAVAEGRQTAGLAELTALGSRWRTALVLDELAALAVRRGDPHEAHRQLASADALRREILVPVPQVAVRGREETLSQARTLLGSGHRTAALTSRTSSGCEPRTGRISR